jgi:hypothetical protein
MDILTKKVVEIITLNDKTKVRQHFSNFYNQPSYCYVFLKDAAVDEKMVHLICTNSQLRGANLISIEVFLQHHAAQRLQMVFA